MKKIIGSIIVLFLLLGFTDFLSAEVKVISVKGRAVYKTAKRWQRLKRMMRLKEGTKISTGVRSSVILQMNRHRVTIHQLTLAKIYQHSVKKLSSKTRIGLRRGSLRAKVFRTKRVKTIFRVSTPVATSSVRGTDEYISYGPSKGMIIKVYKGLIEGKNRNDKSKYISGRLVFHQRPGEPDSDPLLAGIRDNTIVDVYYSNATDTEKESSEYIGDDVIDNAESPDRVVSSRVNSRVNLFIIWK